MLTLKIPLSICHMSRIRTSLSLQHLLTSMYTVVRTRGLTLQSKTSRHIRTFLTQFFPLLPRLSLSQHTLASTFLPSFLPCHAFSYHSLVPSFLTLAAVFFFSLEPAIHLGTLPTSLAHHFLPVPTPSALFISPIQHQLCLMSV
jgi:hypothetical protein